MLHLPRAYNTLKGIATEVLDRLRVQMLDRCRHNAPSQLVLALSATEKITSSKSKWTSEGRF